jgi:hypothetical protein
MPDDYFSRDDPYGTATGEPDKELEDDSDTLGHAGQYAGEADDPDITGEPGRDADPSRDDALQPTATPGSGDDPSYRPDKPTPGDDTWALDKVIFAVIPAVTDYIAAAMAASRLSLRTPGLDSERLPRDRQPYRFIYDLEDDPAKQLTDTWGELPNVADISTERGETLLETAIEQTWSDSTTVDAAGTHLYDDDGEPITDRAAIEAVQSETAADETVFLVPALKLKPDHSTNVEKKEAPGKRDRIEQADKLTMMPCARCGGEQVYQFEEYIEPQGVDERVGFDGPGQPMWECRDCGSARYGPDPNATEE